MLTIYLSSKDATGSAQKIDQVDSENKDMGYSNMIQEKVIKNLQLLGMGVAK